MAREAVFPPIRTGSPARAISVSLCSTITLIVASLVGLFAFLYPLFLSAGTGEGASAHSEDAPLIFGLVLGLTLLLFLLEIASQGMNAKTASVLAALVVIAAALRIPTLPAGATAFFFAVILGGYVFGPRFGFLLGAGALFVSAFAIGGFGPWMPFQVFASGWLGMTAGWLGLAKGRLRQHPLIELSLLAAFGVAWGFLFGAVMNLWFWPLMASGESISWRAGMGFEETIRHYWSFYILTSAGWDVWRSLANLILILALGRPVLDILTRFRDRFQIRFA